MPEDRKDYIIENWNRILGWLPVRAGDKVLILADSDLPLKITFCTGITVDVLKRESFDKYTGKYDFIIFSDVSSMTLSELDKSLSIAKNYLNFSGRVCLVSRNRLSYRNLIGMRIPEEKGYVIPRKNIDDRIPFTRKELVSAARKYFHTSFFYPAPFFNMVTDIYSDRSLPEKTGYFEDSFYYGYDRTYIHHDYDIYNAVIDEGLYTELADAFILICARRHPDRGLPDRVHYSIRRSNQFKTITLISRKFVEKIPFSNDARSHIDNMRTVYKRLTENRANLTIRWNRILKENNGRIKFEYRSGKTLEELLDEKLLLNDIDGIESEIKRYFDMFKVYSVGKKFTLSEKFNNVFGVLDEVELKLLSGKEILEITDIDCIFGNVLTNGSEDTFEIVDYEWSFYFPIPWDYVMWRCIHYYLNFKEVRKKMLGNRLYSFFKIGDAERSVYEKMEKHFQEYVAGTDGTYRESLKDRGSVLSTERLLMNWRNLVQADGVKIYYDRGAGFSEADSLKVIPEKIDENMWKVIIEVPEDVQTLRFDPSERIGKFYLYGIQTKNSKLLDYEFINMEERSEDKEVRIFDIINNDPQILIKNAAGQRLDIIFRISIGLRLQYDTDPMETLNDIDIF